MTWAIVKPHSAWLAQAMDAWAAVEPHAPQGAQRRDLAAIDRDNFALLSRPWRHSHRARSARSDRTSPACAPVGEVVGMPDRNDARLGAYDDDVEDW